MQARNTLMEEINQRFDDAIDGVRDPGKNERQMEAMRNDPLMSASLRALDRMKWDIAAGINPLER